jgi:aspartyl-tRNA(Asn)/glutamyl-tRNA(Gln) amidotransferase subunit A
VTKIDIAGRSALQLGAIMQAGLIDPEEVADRTIEAIEAADPAIFLAVTADRARHEARVASERIRAGHVRGPLDGVPIAWKDLFDMEGLVTTAGSRVLANSPPATEDAAVVRSLEAAGMVAVGKTNLTEFAFSGIGINPHFGTPKNPRSTDVPRIPGGSSSGSAAAVAAGLVPVAMGSDTGGSIRVPAAYNGIVGYKATRGRYPMTGVFPLAASLDSLGVLCRTVGDAVAVDAGMNGWVASPVCRGRIEDVVLIVPTNVVFDGADPGVVAAFEESIARLEAAGATIVRRAMPVFEEILALYAEHGPLVAAEAYVLHAARLTGPDAASIDPRVVARTMLGAKIGLSSYLAMLAARTRLIEATNREIGTAFVAFPAVPHVAPPIAPMETNDELFFSTNLRTLRNTLLGNFLDWCGVSLPCGKGEAGMPVGLLLSGSPGMDEALLSASLAVEAVVCDAA